MVSSCCALNCKERQVKGSPYTFHKFPKNENRRKEWERSLQRENFTVTNASRICSKHFEEECFDQTNMAARHLLSNAVPTKFDFPKTKKAGKRYPKHRTSFDESSGTFIRRKSEKRKYFLGDFEYSDMLSPTKATRVLELAREIDRVKTTKIKDLRKKNDYLTKRMATLKRILAKVDNGHLLSEIAKNVSEESETTSVAHHVTARSKLGLATWYSTDPEIEIKEEPMSDTEEGGSLEIQDVRSTATPIESSQRPGVSTTLVPFVISVCSLSKTPTTSSGEILGVPVGELPLRPGIPTPPAANSSATTGDRDNNTSQSSADSMNDTEEDEVVKKRDRSDVYGEYIATRLRGLDSKTSAHVQKAFDDILLEAEMGNYSSHTN